MDVRTQDAVATTDAAAVDGPATHEGGAPRDGDTLDGAELPDAGAQQDAEPLDVGLPDTGIHPIGGPCTNDTQCASGRCFSQQITQYAPSQGYCTKLCGDDSECGADAFCSGPFDASAPNSRLCLHTCTSTGGCPYGYQACSTRRISGLVLFQPACYTANVEAHNGDTCRTMQDCLPDSICVNNFAAYPDGICLLMDCGAGGPTMCPPNSECRAQNTDYLCRPQCTTADDCRPGYICLDGVCEGAVRPIGVPCSQDSDCGLPGHHLTCLMTASSTIGFCTRSPCDIFGTQCGPFTCPSSYSCPGGSICHVETATLSYCVPG